MNSRRKCNAAKPIRGPCCPVASRLRIAVAFAKRRSPGSWADAVGAAVNLAPQRPRPTAIESTMYRRQRPPRMPQDEPQGAGRGSFWQGASELPKAFHASDQPR
jgi:hypothetical protein